MVLWLTRYPQVCARAFCGLCAHTWQSDIGRCSAFDICLITLQCFCVDTLTLFDLLSIWRAHYMCSFHCNDLFFFFLTQHSISPHVCLPSYDECATPEAPSKEIVMPTWRRQCYMLWVYDWNVFEKTRYTKQHGCQGVSDLQAVNDKPHRLRPKARCSVVVRQATSHR